MRRSPVENGDAGPGSQGLVSVVIPYFERPDTISGAVRSVYAQSYGDWELIIVDDGSRVPVDSVLGEEVTTDPRVRTIALPSNSGRPAVPRNHGVQAARGEFIAFLDSDDLWHPKKLRAQMDLLQATGSDMVSCRVWAFREDQEYHRVCDESFPDATRRYATLRYGQLLTKNFIRSGSTVLVRRSSLGHLRFNEEADLTAVEDYDLWLRIHRDRIERSLQLKDPLVGYRLDPSQISASKVFMIGQRWNLLRRHVADGKFASIRRCLLMATHIVLSGIQLLRDKMRAHAAT